jgi:hypothetical protein
METRSVMPTMNKTAARKDRGGDWASKDLVNGCDVVRKLQGSRGGR